MSELWLLICALFLAISDEGRRLLPLPIWAMPLIYTLLTAMSLLAAFRARSHPSRLRRYSLNTYAVVALGMLPARAYDEPGLARIAFALLSTALMYSFARSPQNFSPTHEETNV